MDAFEEGATHYLLSLSYRFKGGSRGLAGSALQRARARPKLRPVRQIYHPDDNCPRALQPTKIAKVARVAD